MKELLHSKVFRRNLKKWLFMYVGTICLLTSVITYSKYISAFNGSDSARPAKFNVKVNFDEIACPEPIVGSFSSTCDLGSSRPLPAYDFKFNVDTSELEVNTLLVLTLKTGEGFTLPDSIVEVDETGKKIKDVSLESIIDSNNKKITLNINDSNRDQIRYYKATLAYDNEGATKFNVAKKDVIGLMVDYSATQID